MWTARGDSLVGSGDAFELVTAARHPAYSSANDDENGPDAFAPRSDHEGPAALDLGAESSVFIAAADSPTGAPLLVVANEVSGTTSIFEVVVRR